MRTSPATETSLETIIWHAPSVKFEMPQTLLCSEEILQKAYSQVVEVQTHDHLKERLFACIHLAAFKSHEIHLKRHFVELLYAHPYFVADEGRIGIVYDHHSGFRKLKSIHHAHADQRLWGKMVAKTQDSAGVACNLWLFSVLQKKHTETEYHHAIRSLQEVE